MPGKKHPHPKGSSSNSGQPAQRARRAAYLKSKKSGGGKKK
jgi:hypothetical protein